MLNQMWTRASMLVLSILACGCIDEQNDLRQTCSDECATITGHLTTDSRTKGIANATLTVYWVNVQYLGGGIVRSKAVTKTGANGSFSLKFGIREDELLDGYFEVEHNLNPSEYLLYGQKEIFSFHLRQDMRIDTTITVDFLIPQKAFVNCKLLNGQNIRPADIFFSQFDSEHGNQWQYPSGSVVFWYNNSPANRIVEVAGNQPIYVLTVKNVDGIHTERIDTLFVPAKMTLKYYEVDFNN